MKVAICDDQQSFIVSLRKATEEYFLQKDIAGSIDTYSNGAALLQTDLRYDAVFLDVELGDSNGIDIAQRLQQKNRNTVIIIVTAHRGYLDSAMDIHAARFIDKPIERDRVFSALDKAVAQQKNGSVTVHTKDNRMVTLQRGDVIYAEARLRTSLLVTVQETLTVREGIHRLQDWLTGGDFAVPHNSYVVNMNYIKSFRREELVLTAGGETYIVPVSSRRQAAFKKEYIRFIGEG